MTGGIATGIIANKHHQKTNKDPDKIFCCLYFQSGVRRKNGLKCYLNQK